MSKFAPALSIRLTPEQRVYIDLRSKAHGNSLNGELVDVIKEAMTASPFKIVIRALKVGKEETFAAAWFEAASDFFQGEDEDAAYEAAVAEMRKHGLRLSDVKIERRDEALA